MELISHPIKIEQPLLRWFADNYPSLAEQIRQAKVIKREYSGHGFFVHFDVPETIASVKMDKSPLDGPFIRSEEMQPVGGDSLLFMREGYIDMLEMYAFDHLFPRDLQTFELIHPEEVT